MVSAIIQIKTLLVFDIILNPSIMSQWQLCVSCFEIWDIHCCLLTFVFAVPASSVALHNLSCFFFFCFFYLSPHTLFGGCLMKTKVRYMILKQTCILYFRQLPSWTFTATLKTVPSLLMVWTVSFPTLNSVHTPTSLYLTLSPMQEMVEVWYLQPIAYFTDCKAKLKIHPLNYVISVILYSLSHHFCTWTFCPKTINEGKGKAAVMSLQFISGFSFFGHISSDFMKQEQLCATISMFTYISVFSVLGIIIPRQKRKCLSFVWFEVMQFL